MTTCHQPLTHVPTSLPCIDHGKKGNWQGYTTVKRGGIIWNMHRLICGFTHNMPLTVIDEWQTRHLCGNARCIRVEHLVPGTPTENEADKVAHGTAPVGVNNPRARLSEDDVRAVRRLHVLGSKVTDLSEQFDVSPTMIGHICKHKRWSHVTDGLMPHQVRDLINRCDALIERYSEEPHPQMTQKQISGRVEIVSRATKMRVKLLSGVDMTRNDKEVRYIDDNFAGGILGQRIKWMDGRRQD